MEVVCSSEQSTDKMSDDPEVSVAIEQSSPPPETDELVNDSVSTVPQIYPRTPEGTSQLPGINNEKAKDTDEASKIEEKAEKEHCSFRFSAALCTGLENSGKTSFCNLLMDKNVLSPSPGNSHATFVKWTTQNPPSKEETKWTEISSEKALNDVINKLSNYNRQTPEESGILDVLFLLDVNVPTLALCLLQRFLVTFVTYKMHGKKFDNCPPKFFTDRQCYSQFVKEFLSSTCIGQKYKSEISELERNTENCIIFVGICKETGFELYGEEAELVNESLGNIKAHINCPTEKFPITIQRINNQYLHLVNLQNHNDEHSKKTHLEKIKSKLEIVVANNCTQKVQLDWMLLYFGVQKFCIKNGTYFVEYAVVYEKIWKVVCHNSNEDELKGALKFFHNLGALLYFDSVEGMDKFVITDLRWIFDNLKYLHSTKDSTYQFDDHYDAILALKYEGQLMSSIVEEIKFDQTRKVKFEHFVKLLEHLKFVAPVSQGKNYFMPSILDSYEENMKFDSFVTQEFEPLLITYSSGSLHHSIFCYLAAHMFDKAPPNWSKLRYSEGKKIQHTFKNLITFSANIDNCPCYVCIVDRTFFLEIHIYRKSEAQKFTNSNPNVLFTVFEFVKDSLKAICDGKKCDNKKLTLPYKNFKYGFACCMCGVEQHVMEAKKHENKIFATCITTGENEELKKQKYAAWFTEPMSIEESTDENNDAKVSVTNNDAKVTDTNNDAEVTVTSTEATDNATGIPKKPPTLRQLLKYQDSIGCKWFDLGEKLLGDKNIVIKLKKEHPPNKQCNEMFRLWLQEKNPRPPPSWESLISTLKEIGLKEVAKDIIKEYNGGQMNTQDYYSEPVDNDFKGGYQYGRRYTRGICSASRRSIKNNPQMVTGQQCRPRSRLSSGAFAGSQRLLTTPTGVHDGSGYDMHGREPHSAIVGLGTQYSDDPHSSQYSSSEGMVLYEAKQ